MNVEDKLAIVKKACEDKKGIDIKVLDIKDLTSIADYFVIVSANASTGSKAIADEIDNQLSEAGYGEISKDGYQGGRWILLDLSDIIVHIFHKEEREYYNLERLWTEDFQKDEE
nr:ribosome silencing factor [Tissierella sp.]